MKQGSRAVLMLFAVGVALLGSGCGGTLYAYNSTTASTSLEAARALGAEQYAPYEFYYAEAHLDKAAEEAASANYGDAIEFASVAEDYATKAIELSKGAHEGGGR